MTYQKIQLETFEAVMLVRLNVPATKNALTVSMLEEMFDALKYVAAHGRALVLCGAGGAFCSGASLSPLDSLSEMTEDPEDFDAGLVLETHINPIMNYLRDYPLPWISAVAGAAAGAGASLALAGDLVIAGESAFFLQAFSRLGLVPDGGATYLLGKSLSRVRAMELMLLAERLSAQKALEWGLVNEIVPDESLETRAVAIATSLVDGPTRAYSMIRKAVWAAQDDSWQGVLQREREMQLQAGRSQDFREGLMAFQEKRPAVFVGQ